MTSKRSPIALRLTELQISAEECAQIVRRPVEEVVGWIDGADPDDESRVLLRLFMDEDRAHAAQLAAERVRSKRVHGWQGEDWQTAEVERPYGAGHQGTTGGPFQ